MWSVSDAVGGSVNLLDMHDDNVGLGLSFLTLAPIEI